jgi:superfamily II DNA or RNA helicase
MRTEMSALRNQIVPVPSPDQSTPGYSGRRLGSHAWAPRYSSGRDDLIGHFYAPAFYRSRRYDRAVGYFRSTLFSLLPESVAAFALDGGNMRLLCSPELTAEDIAALQSGLDAHSVLDGALLRELHHILSFPRALSSVEMFGALVATGTLELRFALPSHEGGLFHAKLGIFHDEQDAVSFSGSVNDSWSAWHPLGNHESFEVFTSWGADAGRVVDHQAYFESLWDGQEPGVEVHSAPEAFRAELLRVAGPAPGELLERRRSEDAPRPFELLDYQVATLNDWMAHGHRGVVQHATGAGKTVTAIAAAGDWLSQGKPVLILVPNLVLLEQWAREVERQLADIGPSVLLAGGANDRWRRRSLLRSHLTAGTTAGIVIATMQTAASDDFLQAATDSDGLLLIADEVHRLGSPRHRQILQVPAAARLGLSATPRRSGDPTGSQELLAYFERVVEPRISLADAIAAKRLCEYEYFPQTVDLTADEEAAWLRETQRIKRAIAQAGFPEINEMSESLKLMLIRRAAIVKQAENKMPVGLTLVTERYRPGQRWLVYCDNAQQLARFATELRGAGLATYEYHSAMAGDRAATLDAFERTGGVLVSIRCLDEGVDIPAVSHALIIASSASAREHIQRRGRVLRRSPDKHFATVYDLIVLPDAADKDFDALCRTELARSLRFAQDAANASAGLLLEDLARTRGLDPADLVDEPDFGDPLETEDSDG